MVLNEEILAMVLNEGGMECCYINENESTSHSKCNHYFKILQIMLPQNAFLIPHKAKNCNNCNWFHSHA